MYKKVEVSFKVKDLTLAFREEEFFDHMKSFINDMAAECTFLDNWGSEIEEGGDDHMDILNRIDQSITWGVTEDDTDEGLESTFRITFEVPTNMNAGCPLDDDSRILDEVLQQIEDVALDVRLVAVKSDLDEVLESVEVGSRKTGSLNGVLSKLHKAIKLV